MALAGLLVKSPSFISVISKLLLSSGRWELLTARFSMSIFVLFRMFLLRATTRTTRMLPMEPMMMMREKRIGTR